MDGYVSDRTYRRAYASHGPCMRESMVMDIIVDIYLKA